jgi:hypothetical protein
MTGLGRIFSDAAQAFDNLRAQKTRTLLTALGIVFGVGSVIGMLAIGAGATCWWNRVRRPANRNCNRDGGIRRG